MQKIILATKSLYRQEAFRFLDLDFSVEVSNVDERADGRPKNPEELVKHLSKLKAEAVAKNHSDEIIIGFDSVGWFNNMVLEKPKTREEAFKRLKSLSGNTHMFYTGVYMINTATGQTRSRVVETKAFIRVIKDSEINKYLDQDPAFDTYALGYNTFKYYSSTFLLKIEGSCNNIVSGIPLEAIVEMLRELGYKI